MLRCKLQCIFVFTERAIFLITCYDYKHLRHHHIGLVPAAHIDVNVVRTVEVVALNITVIEEVRTLHSFVDFFEEVFSFAGIVIIEPVHININVSTVSILTKIKHTALDRQHQRAVMIHTQRAFHVVFFENSFNRRSQFSFELLGNISHSVSPLCCLLRCVIHNISYRVVNHNNKKGGINPLFLRKYFYVYVFFF